MIFNPPFIPYVSSKGKTPQKPPFRPKIHPENNPTRQGNAPLWGALKRQIGGREQTLARMAKNSPYCPFRADRLPIIALRLRR